MIKIILLSLILKLYILGNTCDNYDFKFGKPEYVLEDIEEICYSTHAIGFNIKTKMAQWVEYKIEPEWVKDINQAYIDYPREKKDFKYKTEDNSSNISIKQQLSPDDYKGLNNIHRGHLAPYRNVGVTKIDKININKMVNLVPQNGSLNTGCWRSYETSILTRARNGESLSVIVGTISPNQIMYNLEKKEIKVPSFMYMFIINNETKKTNIVLFKNIGYEKKKCKDNSFTNYSEIEIENKTNINFYPKK